MPGMVYLIDQLDSVKVYKTNFPRDIGESSGTKVLSILVDCPKLFESKLLSELMKFVVPNNDGKTFKMSFVEASKIFEKVLKEY